MGRVIFLLEEPSMRVFLEVLLPRLFPDLSFLCVPHEGKADLERNIDSTLRQWREPGARFVIVRDNDNGDCLKLKNRLLQLCFRGGRSDTLVSIVCQELESWYLSEPDAMADAFGDDRLREIGNRSRFRHPEARPNPSADVASLIREFRKIAGARRMAEFITRENNRSHSFAVFLNGVERLLASNAQ